VPARIACGMGRPPRCTGLAGHSHKRGPHSQRMWFRTRGCFRAEEFSLLAVAVIIRKGDYPLYDVRIRIRDMDVSRDVFERPLGEINAQADYLIVKWPLPSSVYYRVFCHARNGSWNQDLILKRSDAAQCWLAATRVFDKRGKEIIFQYVDHDRRVWSSSLASVSWCSLTPRVTPSSGRFMYWIL
jgi:hypothetical protein